jgi:hypothetical protein
MQESCLYVGTVVHKRLRPKAHALAYRVFSLHVDLDRVGDIDRRLRLFSYNGVNAVSLHDRDHGVKGRPSDDATPLAAHARATFAAAGVPEAGARVFLLCCPRVLGYGFNPISVYYGYDAAGRLAGAIYEVNNTFGERHSYVAALDARDAAGGAPHVHGCRKQLYVSPFTPIEGSYSFRLTTPGDGLVLGVMLRDRDGPLLKTHLTATARPLDDATLARLSLAYPAMTAKVIAGIHYEALKLWLKGVPLTTRPVGRPYGASVVPTASATRAVAPALPNTRD